MRQTAFLSPLLVSPFIYSPAHSGLDWQTALVSFPKMPIYKEDGTELHLRQFIGKPLLINFWATWCAPCIIELPHLDEAVDYLKQKGVELLLVSTDRGPRHNVSAFLDNLKIFKPLRGFDPEAIWAKQLEISALPVTFLVNSNQTKAVFLLGTVAWSKSHIIRQIHAQLELLS